MPDAGVNPELVASAPEMAELVEVAQNVFWSRMPLPGKLNHINIWLFREDDGFSVLDTGMYTADAEAAWTSLLASLPEGMRIRRVFVTHLHPDHVGMAGWLMERGADEFWMTRMEYLTCRVMVGQSHDETVPEDFTAFHRAAGWPDAAIDGYYDHYHNYGRRISRLPRSYQRLEEGQFHVIGGHRWRVITGNGHSPEHACLYCEESKLLISGDQVLPGISSNVSVTPLEPTANPMADWLASLRKLKLEIPDDVLVLPAHQHCFKGLHGRINALLADQERALVRLREALSIEPKRVIDLFPVLFGRDLSEENFMIFNLATGEALACLNYLVERAEVDFVTDSEGVCWYHIVESQKSKLAQRPR